MMIRLLSMGWGRQSWTIAAMIAHGVIDPVDVMIHSDTGAERAATYAFAAKWTPWLEAHGQKVVTVRAENTNPVRNYEGYNGVAMPVFTANADGSKGQLRRQCTNDWKIAPLRKYISEQYKPKGRRMRAGSVECLLGISTDEWQRAKDADVKYIKNSYPLLELGMSRRDCDKWLLDHGLELPPKSSCIFCPYRSKAEWAAMKSNAPEDFAGAVRVDDVVRNVRPPFPIYLHPSCLPLAEAVTIPEDYGYNQLDLLSDAACDSGHCFM